MAFFPANFYNEPSSFTPLFRLLDDFDNYSRQTGTGTGTSGRRSGLPHWQPKFDLRETGEAYELHGELPGVAKENVQIEFSDPQTLIVRGRAERVYTAGSPPAGHLEGSSSGGAITEGGESSKPHRATVEDDTNDTNGKPGGSSDAVVQQQKDSEKKSSGDKAKYWLTERSVGEFSRTFSFPTRVDQEAVSASFKDGILNITVPKAKKHESRRIAIN
ncbi:HSP20-like chaperone [Stachybotrys elegans]|uniref:HSP20-like chaperone n=1 Tax=Stachybotrys elegans TaxID=80388 RepID=A0A8K0WX72_9HYPO|nr:HSP20-like chaperone [Stachybotrys elegans]